MADEKLLDTCSNTGSKQPHESRLFNPKMKYQGDPSNLWPTLKGDAVSDFILKNSGAGDWMTVIVGDDDRQPADGSVVLGQARAAAEKSQLKAKQRRRKTAEPSRQVPPFDARAQMRAMVTWKVKLSATLHLVLRCKAFS